MLRLSTLIMSIMLFAGHAMAEDKVTLMLNWYVYSEHAPFYYGKAKGFFKDESIDLDIQEGRGSAVTVQAVAAGTVDFGYVDVPTMIRGAIKGAPVKAVGVLLQTTPMSAMSFAEKGFSKPNDLKGKIVATTPGDSLSQIWPLFLKKVGIKESELNIVSGDAQTKLNAVVNGRADFLLGYPMDQGIKIKDATGKSVTPILFADSGVTLVSSGIVTRTATTTEKADLVRRFMAAATKSVETAMKDPNGAADSILAANPKGGQRETLHEGFDETIRFYKSPDGAGTRPFRVSDKVMAESVDTLVEWGGLDASAKEKLGSFYTNDFLPK